MYACDRARKRRLTILKWTGGPPKEVRPRCQHWRKVLLNWRRSLDGRMRSQLGQVRTPMVG